MTVSGARLEPDPPPDPDPGALARELADLRAQVRDLSERLAQAERRADIDVLTPLLNRRAFMREVQRAIAVARRHDIPASVILFDLDGFKGVNDHYGHAAGDAALIAVAERLQGEVRKIRRGGTAGRGSVRGSAAACRPRGRLQKAEALRDCVMQAPVTFKGVSFSCRRHLRRARDRRRRLAGRPWPRPTRSCTCASRQKSELSFFQSV